MCFETPRRRFSSTSSNNCFQTPYPRRERPLLHRLGRHTQGGKPYKIDRASKAITFLSNVNLVRSRTYEHAGPKLPFSRVHTAALETRRNMTDRTARGSQSPRAASSLTGSQKAPKRRCLSPCLFYDTYVCHLAARPQAVVKGAGLFASGELSKQRTDTLHSNFKRSSLLSLSSSLLVFWLSMSPALLFIENAVA